MSRLDVDRHLVPAGTELRLTKTPTETTIGIVDDDRKSSDPVVRKNLHEALRFAYGLASQSQEQIESIDVIVAALVKVLLKTDVLDPRAIEALLPDARRSLDEQRTLETSIDVSKSVDKYAVESPKDLDCEALIPLCKGRCCRLTFSLSFQDLDEGSVRWDYARPYRILHGSDGYCVHSRGESRGCDVYTKRPAVCRSYDCRKDARVWADFDKKIPASPEEIRPQPARTYQIRQAPRGRQAKPIEASLMTTEGTEDES